MVDRTGWPSQQAEWVRQQQDRRDERLRKLMDPVAAEKDAFYAAQIAVFRNFLVAFEDAMEDENVDHGVIQRVLNRVVYATPSGADAYLRIEANEREFKQLMETTPIMKVCTIPDCGCSGYAHS
jgi:hypothetical protein